MNNDAARLIDMKRKYLIPCVYHFYEDPPVIVRGEMQYLYDREGKRYTDFYAGVTVMNCGHCNPEIIDPVIEQIRTLQHTTTIYLTEPMLLLAEKLVSFLDCSLKKVFFVNSGSEANEGAFLLSRLYTGKNSFIALRGGLHGRTALTMDLTGIDMWRTAPNNDGRTFLGPKPHCAQCPLSLERVSCELACVDEIEQIIIEHGDIAAMIVEPIQGNGGIVEMPVGYLDKLRTVLHRHDALLILDEVQTGFGRTGRSFAFKRHEVEPDILTVAKALGNGFPIAAFCTTAGIAAVYTRPGASTTGANAVSSTAALSVLAYIERHCLSSRAAELGLLMESELERMRRDFYFIREIRGCGLMFGMELGSAGDPMSRETDIILERMKDVGFLLGKTGCRRNVVSFMPPLIVEEDDISSMFAELKRVLGSLK